SPTVFGQAAVFTATATSSSPGAGTPNGVVQFVIDGVGQTPVQLDSTGKATLSLTNLPVGNHTFGLNYMGSADFAPYSSPTLQTHTVNKAATNVTITSSSSTSFLNQPVTFTATVTPVAPGGGTPAGQAVFIVDGQAVASVALNSAGVATYTTSSLSLGSHSVTVIYTGNSNYLAAGPLSGPITQNVQPAAASLQAFVTGPSTGISVGTPFSLSVVARDSQGNVATSYNSPVSLSLDSAPPQGTLNGTLTGQIVNGQAQFNNLSVTRSGSYVIRINANGLTTTVTVTSGRQT